MWSISPSFREAIEHSESSMSRDRAIVGKCYRSQSSFRSSMTKTKVSWAGVPETDNQAPLYHN